jgi:RHS repeat-associated protein
MDSRRRRHCRARLDTRVIGMPCWDHRYLWDAEGNLLLQEAADRTSSYAYDAQDRLAASATVLKAGKTLPAMSVSRYLYDGAGNRVLSQQDIDSQDELTAGTRAARYAPGSQRWLGDTASAAPAYDPTGQPVTAGTRNYLWNAAGQLREVHAGNKVLARYRYDHRGLRVAKESGGTLRHYLYEDRKLRAELSADGAVARQYVYLADQVVAVIDCDNAAPVASHRSPFAQAMVDLGTAVAGWFSRPDATAYLHTNHLGAVEAATDHERKLLWRAAYHPYGKLASLSTQRGFELNLRLPGQYLDAETGLHYNDRRYYDPELGQYLTPDPIGLHGGVNSYAYVDGNPLKYVDPSGLILFAFDGTGNSANPVAGASLSNVWKIYRAYDVELNGKAFYITGIGTTDINMSYKGNILTGDGFDQRVALGFRFLDEFIDSDTKSDLIDIDVVGFSRGAAEARVWLNQLVGKMRNTRYTSKSGKTRCLNLRFEGLFDTVSHLSPLKEKDPDYTFGIPAAVRYAAHAVAVNEHRGGVSHFDVRSILDAKQSSGGTRIEQGFIGAHSDIGGGYASGDLSDVALTWMLNQARGQGIKFVERIVKDAGWDTVTLPIIHDSSTNGIWSPHRQPRFAPRDDNRTIIYTDGTRIQATMDVRLGGYTVADTKPLIHYYSASCGVPGSPAVGLVNMAKYSEWTKKFGLTITFQQPSQTHICQ